MRNIGVIFSYNGEIVLGEYLSTTGELTVGATVYYQRQTSIEEDFNSQAVQTVKDTCIVTANDEEIEASNIYAKYLSK